jgi:HD-GYP domain-containing protein (c-di-GMP phosphodiesterase class II)
MAENYANEDNESSDETKISGADQEAQEETPRRKVNIVVATAACVLVLIIAAGVFFSFRFVEGERLRALNEWQIRLGIVADSRVADINNWVEANFDTITELTENASLQLYLTELSESSNQGQVGDGAAQQGYLRNLLVAAADRNGFAPSEPVQETNSNVERAGIAGMALTDSNGRPIVVTPEMPPLGGRLGVATAKALDGEPSFIDMYKGATNKPTMGFALPVFGVQADSTSKGIGVAIGVRVIGTDLFELLNQPGDASKTSETYLVRKTKNTVEYLSPLRDGAGALKRTMGFDTPDLAAAFAIDKPGAFGIKRDYAGEEVLVTSRAVADLPWLLVRKISRAEALSANESRLKTILIVFVLIIVGVTVAMIAVWRHGTSLRAAAAAEKFRIAAERFENISKFMRVITNSQSTQIVAVDGTTSYTFSNEPAAKAAGIETEDMLGKTMASIMGPVKAKYYAEVNKDLLAEFARAQDEGMEDPVQQTRKTYIQRFEIDDSAMEIIKSDHIPLRGDRDHPPGILMILDDITEFSQEQIKSENRLRQLVTKLATIVDRRDPNELFRSAHVGEVARAIAEELECEWADVDAAEFAGNLRDLGSIFIPENILGQTEDSLAEVDRESISNAYLTSAELLDDIDFEGPVVDAIRQSSERVDGSGPQNLTGDDILLTARIVAVADTFLDLCCPRDGSPGLSFETASNQLLQNSGTDYDRKVVAALLNRLENHNGAEQWAHFVQKV